MRRVIATLDRPAASENLTFLEDLARPMRTRVSQRPTKEVSEWHGRLLFRTDAFPKHPHSGRTEKL